MNKKYLLKSPVKVARLSRLIAKAIDLFIVIILAMFFYPIGVLLALVYLGASDSLQGGQSVGKKFVGFQVVSLEDGKPCSLKQSIIRNLPFLVPLILAIVPIWGWVISIVMTAIFVPFELYLLFKLDSGHRLGDVMADTTVIANDIHRADIRKNKQSWFEPKVMPSES